MSRTAPTPTETVCLLASCEACGAARGQWCTVGQYGHPSPHASTQPAQALHSRRGNVLLEVYWLGMEVGEREQKMLDHRRAQKAYERLLAKLDTLGNVPGVVVSQHVDDMAASLGLEVAVSATRHS